MPSPLPGMNPYLDPLPIVPIPLDPPDADARLDLQAILQRIYDAAGYEDYIYRGQPNPALSNSDAEWSQHVVGNIRTT